MVADAVRVGRNSSFTDSRTVDNNAGLLACHPMYGIQACQQKSVKKTAGKRKQLQPTVANAEKED